MTDNTHIFNDSVAYERFVGTWGRAAGTMFLDWLAAPDGLRWLDVGCGTGLFTKLLVDKCAPAAVMAVDVAPGQIEHARQKTVASRATFQIGDAQALPFPDSGFDVIVSALVINFIADQAAALSEMRRVARNGALIGGFVWDFGNEGSPSGPFRLGVREIITDLPPLPGTTSSSLEALHRLFQRLAFTAIATRIIEVSVTFPDFDSFWLAQMPSYSPTTKMITKLMPGERAKVEEAVRARTPMRPDGSIAYIARANAIKGRVLK